LRVNESSRPARVACRRALSSAKSPLTRSGGPAGARPAHSQVQIAAMLTFARCLRSHGFANFPDPTSTGELTHAMVAAAGINVHQPAALQAADACVSGTHGVITKATVARFVAGQ